MTGGEISFQQVIVSFPFFPLLVEGLYNYIVGPRSESLSYLRGWQTTITGEEEHKAEANLSKLKEEIEYIIERENAFDPVGNSA